MTNYFHPHSLNSVYNEVKHKTTINSVQPQYKRANRAATSLKDRNTQLWCLGE